MAKLAIKGHATRGKEVIEILKMLGGKNKRSLNGTDTDLVYYICSEGYIDTLYAVSNAYRVFTLEEFLEKFPYKVGDKVQHKWAKPCGFVFEVEGMRWDECTVKYALCLLGSNYKRSILPAEYLQPYKEESNKKERHVNQITEDIFIDQRTSKCSLIVLQPDVCDNEVEIKLGDYEIEERDGKTFAVLKKKKFNMDRFCEAINIIKKYSNVDEQYIINMVDCHLYLNISDNIVNQITDEDVETLSDLGFEIFEGTICIDNYFYKYN